MGDRSINVRVGFVVFHINRYGGQKHKCARGFCGLPYQQDTCQTTREKLTLLAFILQYLSGAIHVVFLSERDSALEIIQPPEQSMNAGVQG